MNTPHEIKTVYDSLETAYMVLVEQYLTVDEANVSEALMKQSSNYAFMGAVTAYAKRVMDTEDIDLEKFEYSLRSDAANLLKTQGTRATKDAVDSIVNADDSLSEKRKSFIKTQHSYNLAKNILSSLEHQKDMLVQISSNKRSEVKLHT